VDAAGFAVVAAAGFVAGGAVTVAVVCVTSGAAWVEVWVTAWVSVRGACVVVDAVVSVATATVCVVSVSVVFSDLHAVKRSTRAIAGRIILRCTLPPDRRWKSIRPACQLKMPG
jgi:hypothetical protein